MPVTVELLQGNERGLWMRRKLAVVVGFIGKLPYAGMSLYNLHYLVGLRELGYDLHYVERQDYPHEFYDPTIDEMTDDTGYALNYLRDLLPQYGISSAQFSLIDQKNVCYGTGWKALCEILNEADFVLTLATPTWFDELERCPRRGFVDGDPMFTQVAMLRGKDAVDHAPEHYTVLFTAATRIGMPGCTVPEVQRSWIPTRSVVATKLWHARDVPTGPLPVTCLMHWAAGSPVTFNGQNYGHKDREFECFIDLPQRISQPFVLAVDGGAPRERLKQHGWQLADPLAVTRTIPAYREFIAGSWADLGIAKHAYVASRSGLFSDRSLCYLAAGRPVLHQDTGFTDWLPAGEGVLPFSDMDGVLEALQLLNTDYARHARAARRIAEEHFEASTIVGRMLDDAGFR
jgi:hypothetical protein